MGLKTWRNREEAAVIQQIIEHNFKLVGKYLPYHMLCLSTAQRNLLTGDYLSDGLIVFDIDLDKWLQFRNHKWENYKFASVAGGSNSCVIEFSLSDWNNNNIYIPFTEHNVENPVTHLLIKDDSDQYSIVLGGVFIDKDSNINISSDLPFNGKIIIK